MEQHRLREKLQKRSIVPSENSWDQLSEKLDVHESVSKNGTWGFLKYAAIFLMITTVGLYFFKSNKDVIETPVVVAPILNEEVNKLPEIKADPEIKVAETKVNPVLKIEEKKQSIILKNKEVQNIDIAFNKSEKSIEPSKIINIETVPVEMPTEDILVVEQAYEAEILEAEVDQLLRASRIKLNVNREMSSKRTVIARDLLSEVEDDLDKDFKEKLVEKIIYTLKNPKKVFVTDRENQ